MKVLELMKTHVTTVRPEATLGEAVDLMDLYQTPILPIVDAERHLRGVLTEDDVLRAMMQPANDPSTGQDDCQQEIARTLAAKDVALLSVQDFMITPVVSVSEHWEVGQAARLLLAHPWSRLPVTDDLGRVVGMLSRVDVMQAVFESLI